MGCVAFFRNFAAANNKPIASKFFCLLVFKFFRYKHDMHNSQKLTNS